MNDGVWLLSDVRKMFDEKYILVELLAKGTDYVCRPLLSSFSIKVIEDKYANALNKGKNVVILLSEKK